MDYIWTRTLDSSWPLSRSCPTGSTCGLVYGLYLDKNVRFIMATLQVLSCR
ncbi:hypothetical protein GDO81_020301 [Engystomops pustulosus]|uniref:Uncharacterized protein n=1 Tax=Engystomops pustulosus TaxID=76066 RepID=A0AAV6Z8B8_ENGPU|nr:hypothetical protein GDO81_020301 [Engystomops pustulosus]